MRRWVLVVAVAGCMSAIAGAAAAQEIALTAGRFLGDDLLEPVRPELPSISFSDANLFGLRFNYGVLLVDLEVSGLTGKTAIFKDAPYEIGTRMSYIEGGALLRLLPGPVAPFVAAGLGWHRMSFDADGASGQSQLGYVIGAGLKIGLGPVGFRADVRDHITPLKVDKLNPEVAELLGLDADLTLHNFELTGALIIRF